MATLRTRGRDRLDRRHVADGPDPSLDALLAGEGPVWVVGGEPTLRADLPQLLEGLGARLEGLWTDGWALGRPETVARLQQAGLKAVRIPFHSARAGAHDWLAGTRGAHKRTWQALRTCLAAGLQVDVEVVVTRPTLTHLEETLRLLARLQPHGIGLRPLEADAPDYPAVAARWPQVRLPMELAVARARDTGVQVWLEGFPQCGAGDLVDLRVQGRPQTGRPCGTCPGTPACSGIPPHYLAAFGWQDLPQPAQRPDRVIVAIRPDEETRTVRHRLVQAAATEAPVLHLLGVDHLAGPELLAEALALSFDRVEATGLLHVLAEWRPRDKLRLRHLGRLDGRWLGSDAAEHDAAVGTPGAWDAGWALLTDLARDLDVPSWPDRFRFLRDDAVVPAAVAGLPPCLRPLGWDRAASEPAAAPEIAATTACEHVETCAAGPRCPGLPVGSDPAGIGPL